MEKKTRFYWRINICFLYDTNKKYTRQRPVCEKVARKNDGTDYFTNWMGVQLLEIKMAIVNYK